MAVIEIDFPGNIGQVVVGNDLRGIPSYFLTNNLVYIVLDLGFFTWDPSSLADDNGTTVLKPEDRTSLQAGRWILADGLSDVLLRSELASDTGAERIGVDGGGFLQDVITAVTPEQFFAVGNGTTDDSAKVQMAVTFAGSGVFRMAKGKNYRFNSPVNVSQPLQIFGYGAKVNTGTNQISAFTITSSGASVMGLEVIGGGSASFSTNGRLISVTGVDNGAAAAPTYISKVTIRDCKFSGAGRSAVRADFVRNLIVEDNDIRNVAYCGVELLSCSDAIVHKNFIKDVALGTSGNAYGVYASRMNAADLVRYPIPERVSVCYNHVENVEWEGIDCHGGNDMDFSHNTLTNCGDTNAAIAIIHGDDESSTPIVPATNVRVVGNIVKGAQSFGIAISSGSASIINENITIQANTLENCGAASFVTERCGLRVGAARNVSIVGNAFNFCAPYGIVVNNQYASNISITGNSFRRIVSNAFATPSAIRINRGASGTGPIIISGNTALRASTGETNELVRGLDVESTDGGNIRIGTNNFQAATTKYVVSLVQAGSGSAAVINQGQSSIAVTTGVSTASLDITLPNAHSANTVYTPTAVIFSTTTGNERTLIHCTRLSTTQIRVTAFTANGSNFPANGNINIFWQTMGL